MRVNIKEENNAYKQGVTGSNPVIPTKAKESLKLVFPFFILPPISFDKEAIALKNKFILGVRNSLFSML